MNVKKQKIYVSQMNGRTLMSVDKWGENEWADSMPILA